VCPSKSVYKLSTKFCRFLREKNESEHSSIIYSLMRVSTKFMVILMLHGTESWCTAQLTEFYN
jgi:hypothetical protein